MSRIPKALEQQISARFRPDWACDYKGRAPFMLPASCSSRWHPARAAKLSIHKDDAYGLPMARTGVAHKTGQVAQRTSDAVVFTRDRAIDDWRDMCQNV